ncbi:MAG: hypothetical protein AB7T59_16825 [Hyphomonadaceae bacterium]
MLGRLSLALAAMLLLATACIHALGLPMASRWGEGLGHQEHLAICFMWAHASASWGVVALLWAVTAWRRWPPGPAALAVLIPAYGAAGVLYIDPTFFGGQMLAGSVVLALAGLILIRRPS